WRALFRQPLGTQIQRGDRQRVGPVVGVGALRVLRVAVDRDPDQAAGDRLGPGVVAHSPYPALVGAVLVRQCGQFLLDHRTGAGRQPAVRDRLPPGTPGRGTGAVVLHVRLPDRPARA